MIRKIAIIPYVAYGRVFYGYDGYLNFFRKKRTTVLKENLEKTFALEDLNISVIIDVNHGDLPALKKEGVDLFIIPEGIARYIDYDNINRDDCFILKVEEYEKGTVERLMLYIKNKV